MKGRTASQFSTKRIKGIQIYAKKVLDVKKLPNLMIHDPYVKEDDKALMIEHGVVFFRDSDHADGAIACTDFLGSTFYYQFYVDRKTGQVLQVFLDGQKKQVSKITIMTVEFMMEG